VRRALLRRAVVTLALVVSLLPVACQSHPVAGVLGVERRAANSPSVMATASSAYEAGYGSPTGYVYVELVEGGSRLRVKDGSGKGESRLEQADTVQLRREGSEWIATRVPW
jgi:hypothetical protein